MVAYVARRLVLVIPLLLGVVTISFLLIEMIPGDIAETMLPPEAPQSAILELRHQLGLDKPLHIRYLSYLSRFLRADLGRSVVTRRPVLEEIGERLAATCELAFTAIAITLVVGIPLGIASGVRPSTVIDYVAMMLAWLGAAMPAFLLGLLLILIFSVTLAWLPTFGRGGVASLILPAVTLAGYPTAIVARLVRASLIEVMRSDYVRTAYAKGLGVGLVITKHALRNAFIPTLTIIGLQVGYMLGGAVVTETVFAWPGVGRYAVQALFSRDLPVVQGVVALGAVVFSLTNLTVDAAYGFIDPRIRYE